MGWQDRNYNSPQINYGGNPFGNPLLNLIFGSVPLGTWFGIRVRVHASLLWFIGFRLFMAGSLGWQDALAYSVITFTMVLLHEFGHCFGAYLVGGHAENILLWPLGGIAFTDTARTPWARFVTVACGPAVNLVFAVAFGFVIYFAYGVMPPLNPFFPWMGSEFLLKYFHEHPAFVRVWGSSAGVWLWWGYSINWMMLTFNLIPMYPLDGGKLTQVLLWKPLGYAKSMDISCIVGMVGAVLLGLFGLASGALFLLLLAAFGFLDCFNQRRMLKWSEAEGLADDPYDLSAAWDNPDHPKHHKKKLKKRWFRSAKKALRDQNEQAKIDAILAKVKEKGLHSLSFWEKRALKKATERQRQRDLAERL